ncbi:hypothetical protein Agub_g12629, partial [Astrephomene gubernaculifera]
MLLKTLNPGPRSLGRRAVLVSACASPSTSGHREPVRPVALPSGTLWLLDALQDQYYNVRGPAFVIPRVEEREAAQDSVRPFRAKYLRNKPLPAHRPRPSDGGPTALSLINQAIAEHPTALTLISHGPLLDVDVEVAQAPSVGAAADGEMAALGAAAAATMQASRCTGIVHVPSIDGDEEAAAGGAEGELYRTSSTSPRRTKMLRFTCLANGCRAVNIKPVSPASFTAGTVCAQCARCSAWHLIRDHLGLWDPSRRRTTRHRHGGSSGTRHRDAGGTDGGAAADPDGVADEVAGSLAAGEVPEPLRLSAEEVEFF